jgi:BirA family biotin operon repressor/biotin-[acetyl-CoA-carboxylase] ligase
MNLNKSVKFIFLDRCDSTNNYLEKEYHKLRNEMPVMVAAKEQTAGRGRFERKWESLRGLGVYCSMGFVFKSGYRLNLLPLVVGIAVIELLNENYKADYLLKWPNDVLLEGKKIAGILIHNSLFSDHIFSIIGVGINVNHSEEDFSKDINSTAVSLRIIDSEKSIITLTKKLAEYILQGVKMIEESRYSSIVERSNSLSRNLLNTEIVFTDRNEKKIRGIYQGINCDGGLKLKLVDQREQIFYSGEVTTDLKA